MGEAININDYKEKKKERKKLKTDSFLQEVSTWLNMGAILYFAAIGLKYTIIKS